MKSVFAIKVSLTLSKSGVLAILFNIDTNQVQSNLEIVFVSKRNLIQKNMRSVIYLILDDFSSGIKLTEKYYLSTYWYTYI